MGTVKNAQINFEMFVLPGTHIKAQLSSRIGADRIVLDRI